VPDVPVEADLVRGLEGSVQWVTKLL
jgi:hypothetical protein